MNLSLEKFLPSLLTLGAVVLGVLVLFALGLFARRVIVKRLAPHKTADTVSSLVRPLPWWSMLGGLYIASRVVALSPNIAEVVSKALLSALIVSATIWAADLGVHLLKRGDTINGVAPVRATGVVRNVVRITVLGMGLLVLFSTLGISITPMLTTLGIGGLAVALGLQETLSNLFAGMQITLAGNYHIGDYVKLESGEEGCIEDIQWRTTRVRTLPNNTVLIPNSRLAQSVVTNYNVPVNELTLLVPVRVHYASDLEQVERVALEVARTIMKTTPGGVPEFEPVVRFYKFGDSSIDFNVVLRSRDFKDAPPVRHAFIKALARAFAEQGIVIPFPIRAINLDQERARPSGADTPLA